MEWFSSPGVNLKNSDLEGSQLGNVNLRVATLKGANLQNCILRGAVLAGADLEVRFCWLKLKKLDFKKINLLPGTFLLSITLSKGAVGGNVREIRHARSLLRAWLPLYFSPILVIYRSRVSSQFTCFRLIERLFTYILLRFTERNICSPYPTPPPLLFSGLFSLFFCNLTVYLTSYYS